MRLTKKTNNYYDSANDEWHKMINGKINLNYVFELEQKLGQLEDIEEELGIDLLTLYKAIKNGFYYKDTDTEEILCQTIDISLKNKYKEMVDDFKSYGKTWALTKEELL